MPLSACLYCCAKVLLAVGIAQNAANIVRRGIIRGGVPLGGGNRRRHYGEQNNGRSEQKPAMNKAQGSHIAGLQSFSGREYDVLCQMISIGFPADI